MFDKKHTEDATAPIAPATVPPPPEPAPYPAPGYPKVVFNKAGNLPPKIVNNDEELAALDPKLWTQIPPVEPAEKPTYPQLWYNINVPPVLVASEAEADALGPNWRQFPLPKPAPENGKNKSK